MKKINVNGQIKYCVTENSVQLFLTEDEYIMFVAKTLLQKYIDAFKVLANSLF